jgi:hypothetical protein
MKKLATILLALVAIALPAQTHRITTVDLYTGDPTGVACAVPNKVVQSTTTGLFYSCVGGHYANGTLFNGGTITNPITLPADPTLPLQAATKQYVDNHSGGYAGVSTDGANGLAITGGVASGSATPDFSKQVAGSVTNNEIQCAPSVSLNVCLDVAKTYIGTNETGSGKAVTVKLQPGTYTLTPAVPALTLTAAGTASSGIATYTGTVTGGGSNAFAGYAFIVTGFDVAANNGIFVATASTTTTLSLANANGTADTHAASATAPYQLVSGLTIRGVPTRIAANSNTTEDWTKLVLNGGSVVNCGGAAGCFAGVGDPTWGVRNVVIDGLALTNWTGTALSFGAPNYTGLLWGGLRDLLVAGSSTLNGSDKAIVLYNSEFLDINQVSAIGNNQGLVWHSNYSATNSNKVNTGNSTITRFMTSSYTKSAANNNNTEASISLVNDNANSTLNLLTFVDPTILSYVGGGDHTGNLFEMVAANSAAPIGWVRVYSADFEGTCANTVYQSGVVKSFISIDIAGCTKAVTVSGASNFDNTYVSTGSGLTADLSGMSDQNVDSLTFTGNWSSVTGVVPARAGLCYGDTGNRCTNRFGADGQVFRQTYLPLVNTGNTTNNVLYSGAMPVGMFGPRGTLHANLRVGGCTGSGAPYSTCTAANTGTCSLNVYISNSSTFSGAVLGSYVLPVGAQASIESIIQANQVDTAQTAGYSSHMTVSSSSNTVLASAQYAGDVRTSISVTPSTQASYYNVFMQNSVSGDKCFVENVDSLLIP